MKSHSIRIFAGAFALMFLLMAGASPSFAQKKNKNQTPATTTPPAQDQPVVPLSSADELDQDIGQMLAGLQVGNLEIARKYYADNAMFVSGSYAPPIVGFQNWAAGYQRQRAQFAGMQIVRRNTVVFPHGDVAWATYQWELTGTLANGEPYTAKGQTTLIFNRVGNAWLIVHNHTSVDCGFVAEGAAATAPAPATTPAPTQPPAPK
jgi:ketosteroid isomerase-like protein